MDTGEKERAAVSIPQVRRRRKMGLVIRIAAGVGALVLALGAMFVYKALNPPPPPPIKAIRPAAKPVPPATGPSAGSAAAPGKPAIAAAKPPAAPTGGGGAGKGAEPDRGDSRATQPASSGPAQASDAPPPPAAAKSEAPSTAAVEGATTIAPGVKATTDDVEAASTASVAFRSFVDDARIGGVFQGTPPRALINSRIIRLGQTVDTGLGIVFSRVDAEQKIIIFTDATGATVSKKY